MKENVKQYLLFLLLSILLVAPQLSQHSILLGADSLFHFNRFFDAEQQIENHNLSYFISIYGFSNSGRIINALYGPYIAYLNGFILYILKSWFSYQIFSGIMITFLSAVSMNYLLKQNRVSHRLFLSVMYMMTYGITTWITAQQFLSWGAVLAPLGVSVATRMIRDKIKPINIIEMTLVVSLTIETHMLSALFLVILLSIFFIISLFTVENIKKLLQNLIISVTITLGLTSNIWISLFEVYSRNNIMSPFKNTTPLQNGTVNFLQDNRLYWTFAIIFAIQTGIIYISKTNVNFLNKLVTTTGTLMLMASLPLLPWNYLFNHFPIIGIIQFPYRLLPLSECLLLLGIGLSLNKTLYTNKNKNIVNIAHISMFIITILTLTNIQSIIYKSSTTWHSEKNIILNPGNVAYNHNGENLKNDFYSKDLGVALSQVWKPISDYLPINKNAIIEHPYNQYNKEIAGNNINTKKIIDNKLQISWISKTAQGYHNTGIVKYSGTMIQTKKNITASQKDYYLTDIGTLMFKNNVGENKITISYKPLKITNIVLILNPIIWIIFAILACISKHTKKRKNINTADPTRAIS